MWFGTEDGLNRFDGREFRVFNQILRDSTSIGAKTIYAIEQDSEGYLYIGTHSHGLISYDWRTEKFSQLPHTVDTLDTPNSLLGNTVYCLEYTIGNQLWIGTAAYGATKYDLNTGTFQHYYSAMDSLAAYFTQTIFDIHEDRFGRIWFAHNGGFEKYDPRTDRFTHYSVPESMLDGSGYYYIYKIIDTDINGTHTLILTGPAGQVYTFNSLTNKFGYLLNEEDRYHITSDVVSVFLDGKSNIWLGTESEGIVVVDLDGRIKGTWHHDVMDPSTIGADMITDIYRSRDGLLWVSTSGGGVSRELSSLKGFRNLRRNPLEENSLSSNMVTNLAEGDPGIVWITTWEGGLNRLNTLSGEVSAVKIRNLSKATEFEDELNTILVDDEHNIWIGTDASGIIRIDDSGKILERIEHSSDNPQSLGGNSVYALNLDFRGNLWASTWPAGVSRINLSTGAIDRFNHDPDDPLSLPNTTVYGIYTDRQGVVWLAAESMGLYRFNWDDGSFTRFGADPEKPNQLSNNDVMAIYEDLLGNFWVGSYGGGLDRMDRETNQFYSTFNPEVLKSDVVYSIQEDDNGNIWCSTNKGLARYTPRNGLWRTYDKLDGVQSNEFNPAGLRDAFGVLHFGGVAGLTSFNPDEILDNTHIPPVKITDIYLNQQRVELGKNNGDRVVLNAAPEVQKKIELYPEDQLLSIRFAALDYQQPQKNLYRYCLKGFDNEWVTAGNRQFATYTNLPPGQYTFQVKASNNDGYWNESGTSIEVIVHPNYWETAWFRIFAILVILAFALFTLWFWNRQYKQRARRLEELNTKLKSEIAARKVAQVGYRERESHFRAVIEQSPSPIGILDSRGQIIQVNPAYCDLWGIPDPQKIPEDYSIFKDKLAEELGLLDLFSAALTGIETEREVLHVPSDAPFEQVRNMHLQIKSYPLRNVEEDVEFVVLTLEDITDRTQSEANLRENEEKYRTLFDGANDAIFLMDETTFIDCNDKTLEIFGVVEKSEIVGHTPMDFSTPTQYNGEDSAEAALRHIHAAMDGDAQRFLWRHLRKDGTLFDAEVALNRMRLKDKIIVQAMVRDVTARRRDSEQIKRSLKEKEALLKEVHHRVKNNLQIINSLAGLQKHHVEDENVLRILDDFRNRVFSMALVHEELYRSPDFSEIDLPHYVTKLTNSISDSLNPDSTRIEVQTKIADLHLTVDKAIPCGLIINELVSNSLKYAFPDEQEGMILIEIKEQEEGIVHMEVSDSGIGMPDGFKLEGVETLGLYLVSVITKDQLDGEFGWSNDDGTCFVVEFKLDEAPAQSAT